MGRTIKVVLIGGRGVGKTAILERAVNGALITEKSYVPTIEDIYEGNIETEKGNRERIRFYDTAGLDVHNRTIPSHFHAVADAYLFVYSLTDKLSFQLLYDMKKDVEKNREKKDAPIIVIGNKKDLLQEKVIESDVSMAWTTNERLKHFETTVFNRQSLLEPLIHLASQLNLQHSKATFPQLSISRKNKE